MNVTSNLPDDLVQALDKVARGQRSSRSAIVRESLELYLRQRQPNAWPDGVLNWRGDPDFPPFESLRGTEQRGARDRFNSNDVR